MSVFLDAEELHGVVARLSTSRAHARMADFLIFKRAIHKSTTGSVVLSLRDQDFVDSINEVMATCNDEPVPNSFLADKPLINVFGTENHSDQGYRTRKYYSNGTAVTIPRWNIIDILEERPRKVRLNEDYLGNLEGLLLVGRDTHKPSIDDAALWYHRFEDLEPLFGPNPTQQQISDRFCGEIGLTPEEIELLFEPRDSSDAGSEDSG